MDEGMRDEGYGREDAPPELRAPAVQRALKVVRPVGDALARRGREAADVIGRQGQSLGRYSADQVRAKPLAAAGLAAGVALVAGVVLGAFLAPRRRPG